MATKKKIAEDLVITSALNGSNSPLEVNPSRQEAILSECDKQGVTLQFLVETIKRSCVATKTTIDKFGRSMTEDDNMTQLRGAQFAMELRGEYKPKGGGDVVNQFFDVKALVQQWNQLSDPKSKQV